ncbi:unnamed protein product [Peniophora sp. CBMAI 1063]|nr:unnamed protein product [Peniophora sp. CBMAI 1063]
MLMSALRCARNNHCCLLHPSSAPPWLLWRTSLLSRPKSPHNTISGSRIEPGPIELRASVPVATGTTNVGVL